MHCTAAKRNHDCRSVVGITASEKGVIEPCAPVQHAVCSVVQPPEPCVACGSGVLKRDRTMVSMGARFTAMVADRRWLCPLVPVEVW